MNKLTDTAAQFSAQNLEAGEIRAGVQLTSEQARKFGWIISDKVLKLSRQTELTATEAGFIDNTLSLTARTLIYANDHLGVRIADGSATAQLVKARVEGVIGAAAPTLIDALHKVATSNYGIRTDVATRANTEDAASYVLDLFGEVAEQAGGLRLDSYVADNMQNIIAHYEAL